MSARRFHRSAIRRGGLSAPMRRLCEAELVVGRILDFGCGRGEDADIVGAEKYDSVSFPTKPEGTFDTITCTYVLNTIWLPWDRAQVIEEIRELLAPGGKSYVTVRRDIRGWRKTSWGYQIEVVLDEPRLWRNCRYETYVIGRET